MGIDYHLIPMTAVRRRPRAWAGGPGRSQAAVASGLHGDAHSRLGIEVDVVHVVAERHHRDDAEPGAISSGSNSRGRRARIALVGTIIVRRAVEIA